MVIVYEKSRKEASGKVYLGVFEGTLELLTSFLVSHVILFSSALPTTPLLLILVILQDLVIDVFPVSDAPHALDFLIRFS